MLVFSAEWTRSISKVFTELHEKNSAISFWKFWVKKISWTIAQENWINLCFPSLDSFYLENAPIFSAGQTRSIANVLTNLHENFGNFILEILGHKNFMDYNTRKSIKILLTYYQAHLNLKTRVFSLMDELDPLLKS